MAYERGGVPKGLGLRLKRGLGLRLGPKRGLGLKVKRGLGLHLGWEGLG
jgi:hypothetical protein